ncbi:MAG: biotin carboxylase N-terminal domain-containing protein [Pseudomonadota bacterium]
MIHRLLIANRGEIAVRIARTARVRGVETVAVYSDADADALHVRVCDRAVRLGPAAATESYLNVARVLAAATETGADAIHPGYGFLSENAGFAEAVITAGLTWIGPPPTAIRAMGAKDAAKRAMEAAGVPVVPGYHGEDQDPGLLAAEAARIGYPILIKAAAGGGGKGMRRVDRAEEFTEALARAQSEAAASFGDDRVLVEKFVQNPRHIEVQVFGDSHGRVVHLFERDCSAQRRHQKVIEEAPAPGLTPAFRTALTEAAVRAAAAVGYVGAGTVEFVADGAAIVAQGADPDTPPGGFYFLEMNTRLQVEHPVTEAITGLDLVALQFDVAEGAALPAQETVTRTGHAIEARLYAEDPARGFLPQTGRVAPLALPQDHPGVRVDAGLAEGDAVGSAYDPMIGKIIAHGADRAQALDRLVAALAATDLGGLGGNTGFLGRLLDHAPFREGTIHTGMIAAAGEALTAEPMPGPVDLALAGAALTGLLSAAGPLTHWRAWGPATTPVTLRQGDAEYPVALSRTGRDLIAETPQGPATLEIVATDGSRITIREGGMIRRLHLHRAAAGVTLAEGPRRLTLTLEDPAAVAAQESSGDQILAPLPGLVRHVSVAPGQRVVAGAVVAVIEAMKMEHSLRTPRDGTVAEVLVGEGSQVSEGALIVALEAETRAERTS